MRERPIKDEYVAHIMHFLSWVPLFQKLEAPMLSKLISSMTLLYIDGGEILIQQGEKDRSLYVLWHGRLRVYKKDMMQAEISVGEIVGETSLLTGEPRTATVRAIRDSVLIKIEDKKFQDFETHHPEGVISIAKMALHRNISPRRPVQPGENIVTIAIAPAGDSNHLSFSHRLLQELNQKAPAILVNAERCHRQFAQEKEPSSLSINDWLISLESRYRYVLYETDAQNTSWTERCIRQADLFFLVAEEGRSRHHNSIENALYELCSSPIAPNIAMILVHPDGSSSIHGTHHWLRTREIRNYHHIQLSSTDDFARLIRFITGEALGLVLNGGGLRGFAHAGVLKALEALNISIDYIGGCSSGATVAGAYAHIGVEETIKICRDKNFSGARLDYTFPIVSLIKGKKVCEFYQKIYGDTCIEDLKMPFFCVSSNLTLSELYVHEQGKLWEAVRTSTSIPMIYPPMSNKKGEMLVDGALINNIPVNIMRKYLRGGKVLAVDCNAYPFIETKVIKKPWLSGWKLLFQKLLPWYGRHLECDNIFKIIYASVMFSSQQNSSLMKKGADYLLELETSRFNASKLQNVDELIEIGYRHTMEQLPTQLEKIKPT